jgi:hypothetical protein
LAHRTTLFDADGRFVAYLSYTEMDGYIERQLVERLTPVRSSVHHFRLLVQTVAENLRTSPASLPASVSRANAGACDHMAEMLRARRKVRWWPHIGDPRATRVWIKR